MTTTWPTERLTNQSIVPVVNHSCPLEEENLRVPLAVLYSFIFLFGLAGNVLALWVFFYLHSRRNSVRIFLINVALADLVLIACLPFRVLYHALGNRWMLGTHMCKVVGNLFYMNMYVSITLLGLISMDRYLKIIGIRGSRRGCGWRRLRGSGWSLVACGLLWACALMMVVPMIALTEGNEDPDKCFQYKTRTKARGKAYFNYFMVAVFWLVFVVLLVSYGRIAQRLLRASRDKPDLPNATRYSRTAKKSFVVPLLFTVCFVPYHAFRGFYVESQLRDVTCETRRLADRTNEVTLLFSALNSCLDPVMYFMLSGSVRKAVIGALSRFIHLRHDPVMTNSSTTEFRRTSVSTAAVLTASRGSLGVITAHRGQSGHLNGIAEGISCPQMTGLTN
ncbi:probable G-protein coupled receptor 34a [Misgurnus anguillicaudatus]|uniref:probable G-protein coupled receptor 34a n=1 Tax=Misgurnus anguillicaudatus TaxID=75329 RepID=UPI003CCFD72F